MEGARGRVSMRWRRARYHWPLDRRTLGSTRIPMALDDLTQLPVHELSKQLVARKLSPVELTEAFLARIAAHEPSVKAFVAVTAEESGLLGSRRYVESLTRDERRAIAAIWRLTWCVSQARLNR